MAGEAVSTPQIEAQKQFFGETCCRAIVVGKIENKDWHLPDLITSLSGFAWPLTVLILVFVFKKQIVELMKKTSRIEAFGGQAEFKNEVKEFDKSVQEAVSHVSTPVTSGIGATPPPEITRSMENDFNQIVRLSAEDPQLGMMKLAALIEKDIRSLLAVQGLLKDIRSNGSLTEMFAILDKRKSVAPSLASSIQYFVKIRNEVVHGKGVDKNQIISAIDSGLNLLRAVRAIPHERHVVKQVNVSIYRDSSLTNEYEVGKGVILSSFDINGRSHGDRIFPTTRTHFQAGKQVAWEWSIDNVWKEAWYKDEYGQAKIAWSSAAEFIGRHLDEI